MLFAIIAAGEGSRLSNEGYMGLKPMVKINGEMMIDRLIRIFLANKASSIAVIINESSLELAAHLQQLSLPVPLQIITKTTPSSLHSFHELLQASPEVKEVCLSTTDTIFDPEEFAGYIQDFRENDQLDGSLAVTTFIDDESPLYVDFDEKSLISQITDAPVSFSPSVSGGIYCLRQSAIGTVSTAIDKNLNRMRNFQRLMIESGLQLKAYNFSKIMDVDHLSDITKAEQFLTEIES